MTESTDEGCDDDMCTQDEVAHKSLGRDTRQIK